MWQSDPLYAIISPMSTLTLELPDLLAARLEAASNVRRIPPAQLVQETLEKSLPEAPAPQDNRTLYELMQDAIGCVSSGAGDLSTNPKHMEGYGQWRK
jgi:hypothetical protein